MATKQFLAVIAAATTTHIIAGGCAIREIVISPAAAGTAYTLTIQDQSTPAFVIVPAFTLTVPTTGLPIQIKFDNPQRMDGGVDIITGGTPGSVSV